MKVLIVDDNVDFSTTLADIIRSLGVEADCANLPEHALTYLSKNSGSVDLILLDIEFGFGAAMNGLDLLAIFRREYTTIPVVMISGKGTIEIAVKATKLGAVNFIEKNIITKEKIRNVIEATAKRNIVSATDDEILRFLNDNGIVGKSKALLELGKNILTYGKTELNILITGDTGTGKKLVAKAIHNASRRMHGSFITADLQNIELNAFQTEMFGNAINAKKMQKGLFQQSDKGTLFLYEVCNLSQELQSNLLLPIETKQVHSLGSSKKEKVDTRILASSSKNILTMIQKGTFLDQLYHRLRECEIIVPSINERQEDIPLIINGIVQKYNTRNKTERYFSTSALDFMSAHYWDGNVRELISAVNLLLQTTKHLGIELSDASNAIKVGNNRAKQQAEVAAIATTNEQQTLKEGLAEVDKLRIEQTLMRTNGNISKAAALLGVSRETLHNKIRRYEINAKRFKLTPPSSDT